MIWSQASYASRKRKRGARTSKPQNPSRTMVVKLLRRPGCFWKDSFKLVWLERVAEA